MAEKGRYYIVRERAVPEVLLKVVEAKRLLETDKALSVHEAAEQVGISRSSFYKYQDDILPFHDETKERLSRLCCRCGMSQGFCPRY